MSNDSHDGRQRTTQAAPAPMTYQEMIAAGVNPDLINASGKAWTDTERYWKNAVERRGSWMPEDVNARGTLMRDVANLHMLSHEGDIESLSPFLDAEEAARFGVDEWRPQQVHELASQEVQRAAGGEFAGYTWTDAMYGYVQSPEHREVVFEMGPLPEMADPHNPADVRQCVYDRAVGYQRGHDRIARQVELEPRQEAPNEPEPYAELYNNAHRLTDADVRALGFASSEEIRNDIESGYDPLGDTASKEVWDAAAVRFEEPARGLEVVSDDQSPARSSPDQLTSGDFASDAAEPLAKAPMAEPDDDELGL